MSRFLTTLVVAALVLAACGGGKGSGHDDDPVSAAQSRLAKIDRATIAMRFTAAAGDGKDVGFRLDGPFQLPDHDRDLPVASLTSTRLLGGQSVETRFVSTGKRAWVVTDGKATELRGQQLDALRGSTEAKGADLTALHLSKWFATRKTSRGGDAVKVTGTLDAPTAIGDVLALSGGTSRLAAKDAERLRSLVRSSSVELVADPDDDTIRTLHFDVHFAPDDEPKVAEVLPELAGVDLRFDLALDEVGKPVQVEAPAGS